MPSLKILYLHALRVRLTYIAFLSRTINVLLFMQHCQINISVLN